MLCSLSATYCAALGFLLRMVKEILWSAYYYIGDAVSESGVSQYLKWGSHYSKNANEIIEHFQTLSGAENKILWAGVKTQFQEENIIAPHKMHPVSSQQSLEDSSCIRSAVIPIMSESTHSKTLDWFCGPSRNSPFQCASYIPGPPNFIQIKIIW